MAPSCVLVMPQLPDNSGKWVEREGPGEPGDWLAPGLLGGTGGGWPFSQRGMLGDRTPGESGPGARPVGEEEADEEAEEEEEVARAR